MEWTSFVAKTVRTRRKLSKILNSDRNCVPKKTKNDTSSILSSNLHIKEYFFGDSIQCFLRIYAAQGH